MLINEVVNNIKFIASQMGEEILPGSTVDEGLYDYDFGMKIGMAPKAFWDQYKEFVELLDGFDIDGFCIYGIHDHFGYSNNIFTYNRYSEELFEEAPALFLKKTHIV